MPVRVGIPKSMLYYEQAIIWKYILRTLGADIVYSERSNLNILKEGRLVSIDQNCLPIKVYLGHVIDLKSKKVDYIFVPRIISLEKGTYTCPKIIGLVDIVKNSLKDAPPIISMTIDYNRKHGLHFSDFLKFALKITRNPRRILNSWQKVQKYITHIEKAIARGYSFLNIMAILYPEETFARSTIQNRRYKIGVVGHPYILFDYFLNLHLIKRLNDFGVEVVTSENIPYEIIKKENQRLPKQLNWHLSRRVSGSALHFLWNKEYDAVIHCMSFACGLNTVVGKLIEIEAAKPGANPFMSLIFDEHASEIGLVTRIEAFLDLIEHKRSKEKCLSSSG